MVFDIFAKALSSIASFLFPLFASYKALKTSDPAELTPWLMYWVVLACTLLVESWFEWLLVWIPFYAYLRLLFLLYLVLPQTQGARIIYQTRIHPWLQDNESQIEDFIASAHDRLRSAGIAYLKRAIDLVKTNILDMPAAPAEEEDASQRQRANARAAPQSYTQSLLARFSLPSARWPATGGAGGGSAGIDFYNLLAGAVSAATSAAAATTRGGAAAAAPEISASGTLIPPTVRPSERVSFLATQRERLAALLSALDREAAQLEEQPQRADNDDDDDDGGGDEQTRGLGSGIDLDRAAAAVQRRSSAGSGLSKSRSEIDFEKIEAESGAEEELGAGAGVGAGGDETARPTPMARSGSWVPWGWGASPAGDAAAGEKKKEE